MERRCEVFGPAVVVFVVNVVSSDKQFLCSQRTLIGASENHMLKGLHFIIVGLQQDYNSSMRFF